VSIKIAGVGKRFGDFTALEDIDLDIATGELTALLDRAAVASQRC
jgi:sulfate transport system ATP-binding protein